jgi:acyl-CoA reductase-like NAD-dependent aldehyde dehydrogenase
VPLESAITAASNFEELCQATHEYALGQLVAVGAGGRELGACLVQHRDVDADLDLAKIGNDLFAATLVNNGQTCYASTRILAPRSWYDEVVGIIAAFASSLPVGDALNPGTLIGPLVSQAQRDRVGRYIAKGSSDGARLVAGGSRPAGLDAGWFVQPTVFADVDNSSVIAPEEIFGPVLSIIAYTDVDDATTMANDSDYGLGGSAWTTDPERARDVCRRVRTGTMGINSFLPDPAGPWGGVKNSGIGRESGRAPSPPTSRRRPSTPDQAGSGACAGRRPFTGGRYRERHDEIRCPAAQLLGI